jgi:response regulator RpfG family c-di-GMP phosphodiesterase
LIKFSDSILLKKEILTFDECELLREHSTIGAEIISKKNDGMNIFYDVGKLGLDKTFNPNDGRFQSMASKIALTQHE